MSPEPSIRPHPSVPLEATRVGVANAVRYPRGSGSVAATPGYTRQPRCGRKHRVSSLPASFEILNPPSLSCLALGTFHLELLQPARPFKPALPDLELEVDESPRGTGIGEHEKYHQAVQEGLERGTGELPGEELPVLPEPTPQVVDHDSRSIEG